MPAGRAVHRQCNLCEAHCGIVVEVDGPEVLRIAGDPEDPFSRGYICPKAAALADLYTDPDRLSGPVRRTGDRWEPIEWEEALELAADGLRGVQERHGRDAVATYVGNPAAHNWSLFSVFTLRALLGTRNNYSATSSDQLPQHLVSAEMLGNLALFPIPDIDRTDHMLIIGANPSVSNGSIMTAPGARHRLREIVARGGKVIVVDPRRTETAKLASEHVAIEPGGDVYMLLGMLHVIFGDGSADPGRLASRCDGLEEIGELVREWTPARAAGAAGLSEETIVRLAREFAGARTAVAYGRAGVCQTRTGTLVHWLINVLNVVSGNFDEPGGAMFARGPVDLDLLGRAGSKLGVVGHGRFNQRVSGLPELNGELPVAGLADEILTPGPGQVRGMLIYAGNPVLSAPQGGRLQEAIEQLEFCVAIDPYITETTRLADVILPPVSPLERDDLDVVFPAISVRNHVRYSPAAVPRRAGGKEDWEIITALARRLGRGVGGRVAGGALAVASRLGLDHPARTIDALMAAGPYGILRRGPLRGLTAGRIMKAEHGIDLGPLKPRLPGALNTPGRRLRLAPESFVQEARRLGELAERAEAERREGYDLLLIGRRQLRSNNSWMHNSRRLMKGADRCTAMLHPDDAAARGLAAGALVRVCSRVGEIEVPLEITDELRRGVVSVPHGFGHTRPGLGWTHAAAHPGASVNDITDATVIDRLSGNAAFNSVRVRVEPVPSAVAEPAGAEALATP